MREKYTARLQLPQKRKGKNAEWGKEKTRARVGIIAEKQTRARENNGG